MGEIGLCGWRRLDHRLRRLSRWRCWQIGNRDARRNAWGTFVRIVKRTIKRILFRLVGRWWWQIAYRLVGRGAGTGFQSHQSPALHVLAFLFRLPAKLISDMLI